MVSTEECACVQRAGLATSGRVIAMSLLMHKETAMEFIKNARAAMRVAGIALALAVDVKTTEARLVAKAGLV